MAAAAAAAATAKSLQSCPTLCDPIDSSPPGSLNPWESPGKNTGVGCHFLLQCMKVKSESEVAQSWHLVTPWTAAYQAPPSLGVSRQEYWSGVPLPSPWRHGLYLSPFVFQAPVWWITLNGSLPLIPFLSLKASLSHTEHQPLSTTY